MRDFQIKRWILIRIKNDQFSKRGRILKIRFKFAFIATQRSIETVRELQNLPFLSKFSGLNVYVGMKMASDL